MWFGKLPERWEAQKISELFFERQTKVSDTNFAPLSVSKGGIVPQIATVAKSNAGDNRKLVRQGDFVINSRSDRRGSSGVSQYDGSVSLINIALEPRTKCYSRYYHYLLRSHLFIEEFYRNGRGIVADLWTTRYSEMKTIYLPIPPRDEQDQIVRYLDWKVSQINKLINAKRRQIALLREQKRAVINRAVTRVSDGWETKPLKYWAKSNVQTLGTNTNPDFKLEYLDISSIGHGYVKQEPTSYNFAEAPSRARRIIKNGDTLISTVRTYLRSVCFVDHDIEHCVVSTGFSVLTPDEKVVMPELLSFVLTTDAFIDEVIRNSIGVSYPAINDNKLVNLKIGLPCSIHAQQNLYNKIKARCTIIDKTIDRLQKQIGTIHEYRTRLTSDVLTGKIDVRGLAVPEYVKVEDTAPNETELDDKEFMEEAG